MADKTATPAKPTANEQPKSAQPDWLKNRKPRPKPTQADKQAAAEEIPAQLDLIVVLLKQREVDWRAISRVSRRLWRNAFTMTRSV